MEDHTDPGTAENSEPIDFHIHRADSSASVEQGQQSSKQVDLSKNVQDACLNTLALLKSRAEEQQSLAHLHHVDDVDSRASPCTTASSTTACSLQSGGMNGGVVSQVRS